jgi:hypothetical protein
MKLHELVDRVRAGADAAELLEAVSFKPSRSLRPPRRARKGTQDDDAIRGMLARHPANRRDDDDDDQDGRDQDPDELQFETNEPDIFDYCGPSMDGEAIEWQTWLAVGQTNAYQLRVALIPITDGQAVLTSEIVLANTDLAILRDRLGDPQLELELDNMLDDIPDALKPLLVTASGEYETKRFIGDLVKVADKLAQVYDIELGENEIADLERIRGAGMHAPLNTGKGPVRMHNT